MSIPLSVRIGDAHYTRLVDDLTFRKNVHGTAEIGLNLAQRLSATFPAYEKVHLFDGPDVIAEGRLEDPGRTAGDDGQQWDMSAIGEQARASDRSSALIYVDTDQSHWSRDDNNTATSASADVTNVPGLTDVDGLLLQFNPGQPVDANTWITMAYRAIEDAGQEIARLGWMEVAGGDFGVSYEFRMTTVEGNGTKTLNKQNGFSTVPAYRATNLGSGAMPMPAGTVRVQLTNRRVGSATNVTVDTHWAAFYQVVVVATRYNKDGTKDTDAASYNTGDYVYAHEVVQDLLGRLLTAYDGATADIDTSSTHQIDQLAYPDGVTPEQVLADLTELVPDFYWALGPSDPATGKPSFTWRRWPTTARYEVSLVDGISLPGADAERFNRVSVRWVKGGRSHVSHYDAGNTISGTFVPPVPELDAQGLIREPEIQDLSDEVGSQAAADKFAAEFLLAHGTPPVSGTLSVARKVWDHDTGRLVQPWEIEPGHLVRVRELAESADDLADVGRDGRSVFRIVGMTYTASENTAELELDAPPRTDEVLLAAQISKRNRKR